MARIRTIKPEFFTSIDVVGLPLRTRLTFVGLWTFVDDKGRGRADARLVKGAIWPLDDPVTHLDVADDLDLLEQRHLIERWTDDEGRPLLRVCSFLEHQRINRPSKSHLPPSPDECSVTTHGALTEHSPGEAEAEREAEHGSGGGTDVKVDGDARAEAQRRIARRRAKGEDIGPKLEEIILGDVLRERSEHSASATESSAELRARRVAAAENFARSRVGLEDEDGVALDLQRFYADDDRAQAAGLHAFREACR